jgi:capsular exopolysaccharide synthesis family protein
METFNKQHMPFSDDEDEIDIKEIYTTLMHYKKSILLFTFLGMVFALYYAYFSPNIYQTKALVKIESSNGKGYQSDLMPISLRGDVNNIDDEIIVFQTLKVAQKALKSLNIGTRYFYTHNFKEHEYYKNSPFVVTSSRMHERVQGSKFHLTPLDGVSFKLELIIPLKTKMINFVREFISPISEDKKPIAYSEIHKFGEVVDTEWFTFTVQKVRDLEHDEYAFSSIPNPAMSSMVQGGLSASLETEYGNIISLTFQDTVPLRAKEILNAITRAYVEENFDLKAASLKKKLHFVDLQLKAINKTLQGSTDKLEKYRATNIVIDPTNKVQLTTQKLIDLETQLYEIKTRTDVMDNILNYINTHNNIQGIDMDTTQEANPAVSAIINKIREAQTRYRTLLVNYTKAHPLVRQVAAELDTLKTSLRESTLSSFKALKKRKVALENLIQEHEGTLQNLPKQEQKLEQLTRNFMVNEKIYSFLLQKRAEIAIAESSIVSDTRIIETASMPSAAVKPKRQLIILVGTILGLILGIAFAFLRNFLDNTIKTVEEIERLTDIPIYAALPYLKPIVTDKHHREAIRVLWSNLEFSQKKRETSVITFTSTISGEGKTFTIAQLAEVIAQSNKSVIILDLDMRKATLHQLYELSNTVGMSTLLAKRNTLKEVISKTKQENLHVITSGPTPPNPTALIMSDLLSSIVEALTKHYDYILIDSPPVGLVADAMKLMRISDVTLLVLRANYSKKEFIKNLHRLTADSQITPGIVFNGMNVEESYGYGYGYEY